MWSYARYRAFRLPHHVGTDLADQQRVTDGRAGFLSFGPYITLRPGHYTAGFYLARDRGVGNDTFDIDVTASSGSSPIVLQWTGNKILVPDVPTLASVGFLLAVETKEVEVRLSVGTDTGLRCRELVIFRDTATDWGRS